MHAALDEGINLFDTADVYGGGASEEALAAPCGNVAERLEAWARARDRSLLELAFSWLASQPRVASVTAGATSPEQIAANATAVDWKLTDEELREIAPLRPTGARG